MTEKFELISRVDELKLSCLYAKPEGEPKALVLMSHGIVEYKERYLPLMQAFTDAGYACAINDHRGYGHSVKTMDDLGFTYGARAEGTVNDMKQVSDWLRLRHPGKRLYLYAHSMGSLCALAYLKKFANVNGLILSGLPAMNAAAGAAEKYLMLKSKFKGARFRDESVNKLMFDNYCKPFTDSDSPFRWLNTDTEKVKAYDADPLCGFLCTVDGYRSLIELLIDAYGKKNWRAVDADVPILMLSGALDPTTGGEANLKASADFMKSVGYTNTRYRLYPGMRHEIHNEIGGERVIADIVAQIDEWESAR